MNKICNECGNEFETKRNDAKYCGVKCRKASSRNVTDNLSVTTPANVTDNVTDNSRNVTNDIQSVTESQNVTGNSAINEANVTKVPSAHRRNVTDKPDNETRQWLIEQFEAEDKTPDEIESIMQAQDNYYLTRSHYFIPARMLALRAV